MTVWFSVIFANKNRPLDGRGESFAQGLGEEWVGEEDSVELVAVVIDHARDALEQLGIDQGGDTFVAEPGQLAALDADPPFAQERWVDDPE